MSPEKREKKHESIQVNLPLSEMHSTPNAKKEYSSSDSTSHLLLNESELKEYSSVTIQTDESIETFKNLDALIQNWFVEIKESKCRSETAENENKILNEKFLHLKKQYNELTKLLRMCRKKWQREKYKIMTEREQEKVHYVRMLRTLELRLSEAEVDDDETT